MSLRSLAILALASVLVIPGCRSKPNPETTAPSGDASANEPVSPWKIVLQVTPDHPRMVQPVTFAVHILDGSGKPVDNAQVTGSLTMKTMDMGKTEIKFAPKGNGTYEGRLKSMDMSGPWDLVVEAGQGGFHALKKFEIVIYE